jgi:hypothetical protein
VSATSIPVTPSAVPSFGEFTASPIVAAIKVMYRTAGQFNDWLDEHIEELKRSDNPLIASTGRVLEGAKFGFGVGYVASTALIAVGQYLLGNTFAAITTAASAAVLSNPIAMTCAAIGAIYFGWKALTDKEREQVLEHLAAGLTLGVEMIRAFVDFAIRRSRELLDPSQAEGAKKFIKAQAEAFGHTLYDVTKQIGDFASDSADSIAEKAGQAAVVIKDAAGKVGSAVADGASSARGAIGAGVERLRELATDAGKSLKRAGAPPALITAPCEPDAPVGNAPALPAMLDPQSGRARKADATGSGPQQ